MAPLQNTANAIRSALLAVALAAGCAHAPRATDSAEQSRWAVPVKPSANLYRIDDTLYRSEQLTAADAATLRALGVKTVINLRFFDRNDNETALAGQNLKLLNSPLLTWRITSEHIARTLYMIEQNRRHGAVLIHCYHGADRTGLIAAMYRIVYQGWPPAAAKAEMQQGPYGFHSVWQNIGALFTEKNIAEVRTRLDRLRARGGAH